MPAVYHIYFHAGLIRSSKKEHWLQQILAQDPALALEWLSRHIGTIEVNSLRRNTIHKALTEKLDTPSRMRLLASLDAESRRIGGSVRMIVGDSVDSFDGLVADARLARYHLEPLARKLDSVWHDMVIRALDAGYTPQEIALASLGSHWSHCGNESDMWESWVKVFSRWLDDENLGVREVAEHGKKCAESYQQNALVREKQQAVYGY